MTRLSRRTFIEVLGAGGATLAFSSAAGQAAAAPTRTRLKRSARNWLKASSRKVSSIVPPTTAAR